MQRLQPTNARIVNLPEHKAPINTSFSHPIRENKIVFSQNQSTVLKNQTASEIVIQKAQPNQFVRRPIRVSRVSEGQQVQIKQPIVERLGNLLQGQTVVTQSPTAFVQSTQSKVVTANTLSNPTTQTSHQKPMAGRIHINTNFRELQLEGQKAAGQFGNVTVSTPKFTAQPVPTMQDPAISNFQQQNGQQVKQEQQQQVTYTFHQSQPKQAVQAQQMVIEKIDYQQQYRALKNMYVNLEHRFTQLRSDYERTIKERTEKPTDRTNTIPQPSTLNHQSNLTQLREQNQQLISINRQFESQVNRLMEQLNQKNDVDVDKFREIVNEKEEELEAMGKQIERLATENGELKDHLETVKDSYDSGRIDILQTQIERLNSEIIKKNGQIMSFRKSTIENQRVRDLEIELKNTKYELQSITSILQMKTNELVNLQSHISQLQVRESSLKSQSPQQRQRMAQLNEQLSKAEFQLNALRQSSSIRQGHHSDLLSERDRLQSRLQIVEEQLDRQREDARLQVSQLEQRLAEQDKRARQTEEQLREGLNKANEDYKQLSFGHLENAGRLKQLQEENSQYARLLQEARVEVEQLRRVADEKIINLENIKIDLEGRLTQLNFELEHKTKEIAKLSQNTPQKDVNPSPSSNQQLQAQLSKVQAELEIRRSQYDTNLRKYRKECEDSYRQTLKLYEDKIQELEAYVSRRSLKKKVREPELQRDSFGKEVGRPSVDKVKQVNSRPSVEKKQKDIRREFQRVKEENQKLKKQIDQYNSKIENFESVNGSMSEWQERIVGFEQRISQVLAGKQVNQQGRQTKNIVIELNEKLKKLRLQNQELKKKSGSASNEDKIKQYERENKKLTEGYAHHEKKVQQLINEVTRLSAISQQYQQILYQTQLGQQMLQAQPNRNSAVNPERQKVLEQKLQFYKQKNNELQSRINELIALVTELKRQLEQSGKAVIQSNNAEFIKQQLQLTELNVLNLQQQIKNAQQENSELRSNFNNREMTMSVEFQQKVAQLQAKILELNMRIEILKNEKAATSTQNSHLSKKVKEYEYSMQQLTLQVQTLKVDTASFSSQRGRLRQLEQVSNELTAQVLALTTEKAYFQGEASSAKRRMSTLEQQLKTVNQKLSVMNNANLALEMQTAQSRTKIAQLQQRIKDLNQDLAALHKYKSDSDGFATHERTKLAQYQSRLMEAGYEMQRVLKEKTGLELQLRKVVEDLVGLRDAYAGLESQKGKIETDLNKLQNGSVEAQFKSKINLLEVKIINLNSQLAQLQSEKQFSESQSANQKNLLISQYKQQIEELETRLAKSQQQVQKLQQEASSLRFQISRSGSQRSSSESQLRSLVSSLETKASILSSDINRLTAQYSALQQQNSKLKEDRSSIQSQLIKLQGERCSMDSITRLKISQLEDRLQSFSHSINLAEEQRSGFEQQSFDDKTRITQLESKLAEMTARTNIHTTDKEKFVGDNERLKREVKAAKESYALADSQRNQLRDHVTRLEQTIAQLKMEIARQARTEASQATYS